MDGGECLTAFIVLSHNDTAKYVVSTPLFIQTPILSAKISDLSSNLLVSTTNAMFL